MLPARLESEGEGDHYERSKVSVFAGYAESVTMYNVFRWEGTSQDAV